MSSDVRFDGWRQAYAPESLVPLGQHLYRAHEEASYADSLAASHVSEFLPFFMTHVALFITINFANITTIMNI
jgi:hypothetical protein